MKKAVIKILSTRIRKWIYANTHIPCGPAYLEETYLWLTGSPLKEWPFKMWCIKRQNRDNGYLTLFRWIKRRDQLRHDILVRNPLKPQEPPRSINECE